MSPPLNIIAADDARAQLWLLKSYLSSAGHQLRTAMNGEVAFELAVQRPPDLFITDLEMPRCNGFDFIQAIRHADDVGLRSIPIIVCSSCGDSHSLNRALDCGANSFVTKPLHHNELRLAINNLRAR